MATPGPTGYKNLLTQPSAAASDLFLGDQITEALQTQIEERKKRLMLAANKNNVAPMASGSVMDLGLL